MPAVAGLGAIALAIVAMLCAIAIDWAVRQVADVLGQFGIGPFSINLGGIFSGIVSSVIDKAVDNGKQYFQDIGNFFFSHSWLLVNFMTSTVNALQHVGNQIAHLYNTTIPNAITQADSDAKGYVASLKGTVEGEISAAARTANAAVSDFSNLVDNTLPDDLRTIGDNLTKAVAGGVAAAGKYTDKQVSDLSGYLTGVITASINGVNADIADLKTTIGSQIAQLGQTVAANLATAEQFAQAQASGALSTAERDAANLAASAQSTAEQFATTAANAATAVANQAQQTATTAISTAGTDLSTALSAATADATAAANTAEHALEGVLGGLYQDITGTAAATAGDLTSLEGLLAGAITGAVASVAIRVAKLEECAVTNCEPGANDFSSLLNTALGIGEVAGVLAFLSQVIRDPAGAESEYAGLIGGLFSAGQTGFDTLLSL